MNELLKPCENCGAKCEADLCQACCDHQEICMKARGCLVCGKDLSDDLPDYDAQAKDDAIDFRGDS